MTAFAASFILRLHRFVLKLQGREQYIPCPTTHLRFFRSGHITIIAWRQDYGGLGKEKEFLRRSFDIEH
ncbi:hypothetical protein PanWU01x14_364640 [Parasponia andersonii]|uniref:Uncharacterized protein n=1 Tax=Parasponia andersonii TaxID=3476 RepID=A0A2P5A681_PARAD|nr:hypothetical protein PanWU01x14_364640 [Parasponia andersonii]